MDDLEQQIKAWADGAWGSVEASAAAHGGGAVVVEEVVAAGLDPVPVDRPSRSRRRWLAVAAVVLVVAAIGVGLAVRADHPPRATPMSTTTTRPPSKVVEPAVGFEQLATLARPELEAGSVWVAFDAARYQELLGDVPASHLPAVDFDHQVILAFTLDEGCAETVAGFVRLPAADHDGDLLVPRFTPPEEPCVANTTAKTAVVAVDTKALGPRFRAAVGSDAVTDAAAPIVIDLGLRQPVLVELRLEDRTVAAGAVLRGTVVVSNGSGKAIEGSGCGPEYSVRLVGPDASQERIAPLCLRTYEIAPGTNRYPVEARASYTTCARAPRPDDPTVTCDPDGMPPPLPPGDYDVEMAGQSHLPIALEPVPITVTD